MKIGFTGTRDDMTAEQRDNFRKWIQGWCNTNSREDRVFHHGCCLGADAIAVGIVDQVWPTHIVAHPSDMKHMTSENALRLSNELLLRKPPLDRNRDIVDVCELLLACPKTMATEQRSGTWMTIRYARRVGRHVIIFWPDGTITDERPGKS